MPRRTDRGAADGRHDRGDAMPIQLSRIIIFAKDKRASARFLTDLLDLDDPAPAGIFVAVRLADGVTLHYAQPAADFPRQRYTFLVGEDDFDAIYARVRDQGLTFWADPYRRTAGQIAVHDGRGLYVDDPSGHILEIVTRTTW
ncbi:MULTISPECIES: VOC family protein [Thermomonospora]|uniref:Catechol 2,3-dioxygenase-like lactoylglutathione lyase family enzyme n=1 Tax=Thermomonospora cellulosilytica TaxID=1411118 RepID=A0A7W3R820_9ACTN|nr:MULTISPECIES: VOC family protein [Thermomonospora]MBA9003241.1 catechol 2,3-dioxygenase-like lactoylglutathione lyase family enzyme [Thermomonospora cellulosilytica]